MRFSLFIALVFGFVFHCSANNQFSYHKVKAEPGDGIIKIMDRFALSDQPCNYDAFYTMNELTTQADLIVNRQYLLPILIFEYNGQSIRSTIGDSDYDKALRIQAYNDRMHGRGLKAKDYRDDKVLWVPYHEVHCTHTLKKNKRYEEIFGKEYASFEVQSDVLKDKSIYIISGHGGPDPGALGTRQNQQICEDEYAYDIALRLYRELLIYGADAHMIIQDKDEGIRDEQLLQCDKNETDLTGQEIPLNHRLRLQQRVHRVNTLFEESTSKDQICISIHVDSRGQKQQDVFFCYYPSSTASYQLAEVMHQTFDKKYKKYQRNRSYHGTLDPRNLYVLRHTKTPSILIEIGNIQNQYDHRRFINPDNRQALAKWIRDGVIASFE